VGANDTILTPDSSTATGLKWIALAAWAPLTEAAQDAVGAALTDTATIDFSYNDGLNTISAIVIDDSITFAKIQNIATDRLLGRDTASSGDVEEIALEASLEFSGGGSIQRAALTGDVTAAANSNSVTVNNNAITDVKLRDSGALSVIGRSANSSGDPADISAVAASGAVLRESGSTVGFGTVATAGIADDAVTFAKMQNITTDRLLGRDTTGTGDVEEISLGTSLAFGGAGAIVRSALTGDVTAAQNGSVTAIATGVVTNAKLADMAQATIKGRAAAAGTGAPSDLSAAQVATIVNSSLDHNSLTNLTAGDVHTQYALLAGRSGGQTLKGGTASGDDLTLMSTNHATKGSIFFGSSAYDEVNNRLGIQNAAPAATLHLGAITPSIPSYMGTVHLLGAQGGVFMLNTTSNDAYAFCVRGDSDAGDKVSIGFAGDNSNRYAAVTGIVDTANTSGHLAFSTAAATDTLVERMRIRSDGRVVIGSTGADHAFEVNRSGSTYRITTNIDSGSVNYLNSYSTAAGTPTAAPLTIVGSPVMIASDRLIVETAFSPASAAAAGTAGTITWANGFLYCCVATNTWKRVAIATF
jgi:hypothetical protein